MYESEENEITWTHEGEKKYKIIGPKLFGSKEMEWVLECLLSSLKRRVYSYSAEFDISIPVPSKFYIGDIYFIVEKMED